MASKRFGNFQLKQPSSAAYKKARLDIDIIPSQQYVEQQRTVKTTTTIAKPSSSKSDYLWGDEDDEFIILASQAVEEVEMFQQTQMQQTQGGGDITFGGFLREGVPSSTQTITTNGLGGVDSSELMPPPPAAIPGPAKVVNPVPADVMDLLTDGDDDVFSEQFDENYDNIEKHIDEFFNNEFDDDFNIYEFRRDDGGSGGPKRSQERSPPKPVPVNGETKATSATFKPKQPQSSVVNTAVPVKVNDGRLFPSQQPPPAPAQVDREALKNAAKKKDHAKDMQVKFLTGQLEKANKEREQLKKDYNEVTDRVQIRDGEVSMLRYELKNVKSQNDQLRLEKMKETETIKKEWVNGMKDLEKVIVAQKSELEFKNMEMMNLKTKRMSNSFRTDKASKEHPVTEKDFKIHNRQIQLFRRASSPEDFRIDPKIFDLSAESISKFNTTNRLSHFSKGDAVLSQHLGRLQSYLSQLICLKGSLPEESIPSIVLIANQATDEIRKYCQRLPMVRVKDPHLGAKVAYDFLCKNSRRNRLQGPVNIYQREAIFHHEKAVIQRRFLAALGLLCRYLPSLAVRLVRRWEGTGNCVQVLVKGLCKISYATDLYGHFGLIASAASILCGLSHHVLLFKEDGRQVIDLFKSIVYCRPDSALILSHLSETLYRLSSSDQSIDLLNHLCWQSKSTDFAANEAYKMIQFTKDSCVLQIYASLLETSVPQDRILTPTEIRHLVANTRNTIYFLRNSLARPARWIQQFANRPEGSVLSLCQCHIRITNAFVVLLHQVLRCWMHCPLNIDYSTMLQITQNGVLLLFDLFETVYRGEVLLVGRHVIQCRLQATYNWLVQHQSDFRFQQTHKIALQLLDLRLVMEEPLKSSEDVSRMDVDGDAAESAELERSDMYDDLFEDFFTSKLQPQ